MSVEGGPRQMRNRADAQFAHAAGLRGDAADIEYALQNYEEDLEKIDRGLKRVNAKIREFEDTVERLENERSQLSSYEAYKMRHTMRRWQSRLKTAETERDTYLSRKKSVENQIRQQESVKRGHLVNASGMEAQAERLMELAAKSEGKEPEKEEDFWMQW